MTQQHSNECPSAPVTCPNNCELVVFRSDLERHRNHDCPLEIQQCEFRAVGCQVELPRRDMPEHKRQNVAEHSVALSTTLQGAVADITTLQGDIITLQGYSTTLQGGLQGDITTLQGDITTLHGEMQAHVTQKTGAMEESLDKIQERVITQNERIKCLCVVVVLLASVAVVSIALLAVVVTEQSGQHSMSGIPYRKDQTGFCRFDDCKGERENIGKEGREEWRNELDSKMEQEQKERRNELDIRMEQERKEIRIELSRKVEEVMVQVSEHEELESRMEQEQSDELDRKLEMVMLQMKEYDTGEKEEIQLLQGQVSELQDKLDQEIKNGQRDEAKYGNPVLDVDISMLQMRQNAILKHLKMIPHEEILPFEFEMQDFEKHRESGDMWYSPPFYTDINGYKMLIRVDARGKDKRYISVSLILMAGVADDDLKWPFQEDIKIELINQAGSSRWNPLSYFHSTKVSHAQTLKFSETNVMKYNQRVTSGEMAPQGPRLPYFIAHDKLKYNSKEGTQYLKDDTLKFRISRSAP